MSRTGEKTEKPSARKLLKARREGQVAASRDFVSGLQFTVFVILLAESGQRLFASLKQATRAFVHAGISRRPGCRRAAPIAASGLRADAVSVRGYRRNPGGSPRWHSSWLQRDFPSACNAWRPRVANFNPIAKLKSAPQKGFGSAIQGIALLAVFMPTIYFVVSHNATRLMFLPLTSLDVGLRTVGSICMDILWKAAAFFLVFGLIDLFRQKRRFLKQMRMSKQDVRDEMKETEGNPHIKMRIRRLQRDVRRRRMMDEVKTATAVIVNPTHYAVAIRYHHESMPAPIVVAKGKNYLALRIRARALENQVPLIENPPLAQALYKSVEVGQQIPPHLYRAVAEILAYIFRLMGAKAG